MPTERINYTDALRTGTDKLNQAIDQANKAEVDSAVALDTADGAVITADEAKTKSLEVEIELDSVINRETDSDAMSRQAAVNAEGVDKFNLKTRLDEEYNTVITRLAGKLNRGEVSVSDIDKNLGKFDQTYMSDELLQQITGTTPINAVPADGSMTFDKTSFFKVYSDNLIDKTKLVNGYLSAAGTIIAYASTWTTDFIPVEQSVPYKVALIAASANDLWKGHVYGADKVSLGRLTITDQAFTITDPNVEYVRLVLNHSNPSDINSMMVKGTVYPSVYIPYVLKLKTTSTLLQELLDKTPDNSVSPNITTFFKTEHTNLIDKTKISTNKYINDAGVLTADANADTSDFIPVETGKTYMTPSRYVYETLAVWSSYAYDAEKNPIGRIAPTNKQLTITDINAQEVSFVRIVWMKSVNTPVDMELMMVEGTQYPVEYIPYVTDEIGFRDKSMESAFARKLSPYIKTDDGLYGLTWAVIGDSITAPTTAYHKYVAEKLGLSVLNYGIGETSIAFRTGRTDSMSERYVNMSNAADIVTVLGGTNDGGATLGTMSDRTNTTFYGACHLLFKGLAEKYMGKRLGIMLPTPRDNNSILKARVDAEREVAHYYGIPVLDLNNESGIAIESTTIRDALMPDGLHPSVAGHQVLARRVEAFLKTL